MLHSLSDLSQSQSLQRGLLVGRSADGAPGLHVEFLCRRPAPDEVELSVSLRRLENGESVWGWTWTTYGTDEDHDRVAAEVADRVVTAVRARL